MKLVFEKKYIYLGIFFLILAVFEYFSVFQNILGLNHAMSISFSILLVAVILWVTEWVPLFVTSITILMLQLAWLLPILSDSPTKAERQEYMSAFFSDIILLFMGGFVLAAMLHRYGLDKKIASFILKRTGKKPSHVLLSMMLISALLSMWMSNTATAAMMFAIICPITASIPGTNHFSKAMALCIPFACNLGGLGTPIGTPPNAIAMSYLADMGISVSFGSWMMATVPFMILFLIFVWFVLLKIYPPGNLEIEFKEEVHIRMSPARWLVIATFLLTVFGWFTNKKLGLSIGTVSIFPILVAFGFRLLKQDDFRALPWDVLFMLGGGICLGVGLKKSGLSHQMISIIPMDISFIWVLAAFAGISALMTTFMSNTATANLIIPLAVSIDHQTSIFVITVALTCSTAMSLPISTPPNAIAFGSGLLEAKDMVKTGMMITIFSIFIVLTLGVIYWPIFGI